MTVDPYVSNDVVAGFERAYLAAHIRSAEGEPDNQEETTMSPHLTFAFVQAHQQELHRSAQRARVVAEFPTRQRFARFGRLASLLSGGARRTAGAVVAADATANG